MTQPLNVHRTATARWITFGTRNGVIGTALVRALNLVLADNAEGLPTILTGPGSRFFSPGLDLHEVGSLPAAQMRDFMRQFHELCFDLFSYPAPTIAALNGPALAGGSIIASCCDFRVAAASARIGLTELNLDLGLPYPSQRIIQETIGYNASRRLVFEGLSYSAREALAIGWLDEVVQDEQLISSAEQLAGRLRQQSLDAFRISKQGLRQGLARQLRDSLEGDLDQFLTQWFSPSVQARLADIRSRLRS